MANYYDEPQDNGSSVPLVVGGMVGGGAAGYLANKHFSGSAHGLDADAAKLKGTALEKIREGVDAIKEAEATGEKAFEEVQNRLTVDSWSHNLKDLDVNVKNAVSIDGKGETFSPSKAAEYVKKFDGDKANPVQFEKAIHELETLSRLSPKEIDAHPYGTQFKEILKNVSSDEKTISPDLAETHLTQNPELLEQLGGAADKTAVPNDLKAARVARAVDKHPHVTSFQEMMSKYDGLSKEGAEAIEIRDKKHPNHKNMTPQDRSLHTAERNVEVKGRAFAIENAAHNEWVAGEGVKTSPEYQLQRYEDKVKPLLTDVEHAVADRHAISHPQSMASEAKGVMSKIKSAGTGKAKVAAAAVAGAAVVGGIAHKMFGGSKQPPTRIDPAQMQMMGQQQAAMGY